MDQYEHIRTAHRVYKKSIRQIARETGHTRKTVRKALLGLAPKYRRQEEPVCAVMDGVAAMVEEWLKADQKEHRKQRHTARRIYTRLVEEHSFQGAESNSTPMGPGSESPYGHERGTGCGAPGC